MMRNWVVDLISGHEPKVRKDLEERSGISRREFLVGALAAGAGTVIIPNILNAPTAYASSVNSTTSRLMPDFATATAFQGTVVGAASNALSIDPGYGLPVQKVTLNSSSEIWQYGTFGGGLPCIDDDMVVRSMTPGVLQMGWINEVAYDSVVLSQTDRSLTVIPHVPGHPSMGALEVSTTNSTLWRNAIQNTLGRPSATIVGARIVGYRTGGTVIATEVNYVTQTDAEMGAAVVGGQVQSGILTVALTPENITCYRYTNGNATYFNCGNNGGACGLCNTLNSSQAAWPYIYNDQNCDNGCTNQCPLQCGDLFYFSLCGNQAMIQLEVVDVGPCQRSGSGCSCLTQVCGYTCGGDPCGIGSAPRVTDLTAPTRARLIGSYGCAYCSVATLCSCTSCGCAL